MQLLANILISWSGLAPIAVGASLVLASSRRLPVGLASVMTVVGFGFHALSGSGVGIWIAGILALVVAATSGVIVNWIEGTAVGAGDGPASWKGVAVGLGLLVSVQGVCALSWGEFGRSFGSNRVVFELLGARVTASQLGSLAVCALAMVALAYLMVRTRAGLEFRALRSNPLLAEVLGVDVAKLRIGSVVIGSLLVGLGMEIIVLDAGVTLSSGFRYFLMGLTAAIVGGMSSLAGAAAGSLAVALLQHLSAYYLGIEWMEPLTYGVLVMMLLVGSFRVMSGRVKKTEV